VPCTCAVTVRRDAILAVGGFEERFTLFEDQSLWAKMFLAYPVFVQARCLARYRQHETSVSAQAAARGGDSFGETRRAHAAFLDWLAGYVEQSGSADKSLRSAMRLARAPYGGAGITHLIDLARLAGQRELVRAGGRARKLARLVMRPGKAS
jgi:hypothetical protein